ncbi:MAG: T9SS type A sorting domain-containing protein, partial [Psychroflexus halocasei]
NRPGGIAQTGLISTKGNDGTAVYGADFFTITEEVTLGTLDISGFGSLDVSSGGLFSFESNITDFNVYIFEDNNGAPDGDPESGGELYALANITDANYTLTDGNFLQIDLTAANGGTEITLPAGNYWISAFPSATTAPTGDGRWNWMGSDETTTYNAVLIDPANLFGAGATSWTDASALLGEPFPTFSWVLRDNTAMGVAGDLAEMISVYPNPTSDFVQLNLPSHIEVTSVQMFDLLGKNIDVELNNNKLDLTSFAEGVYMISIETNQGKLTKKIIKK